jgi:mono/diheme cytochrome c family protein
MKKLFHALMLVILALAFLAGCSGKKATDEKKAPESTAQDTVKRGEYLVTIMGCHDCHSPKNLGPQGTTLIQDLLLSGYQTAKPAAKPDGACVKDGWVLITMDLTSAAGPWGVSYAANLTSDQTGTGNWTIENFSRALRQGKYKGLEGTRTLLPPMPWTNFTNLADDDLNAIFAYLKSTKPVNNVVPQPLLPQELGMKQ